LACLKIGYPYIHSSSCSPSKIAIEVAASSAFSNTPCHRCGAQICSSVTLAEKIVQGLVYYDSARFGG